MRTFKLPTWLSDERGISLVELIVGMMILSVSLLGLSAAGGVAARQVHAGRADMQLWAAVQEQVEDLMRLGYESVTSGTGTVQGFPMEWTVTGTTPKRVDLVVQRTNLSGSTVADTLNLYMANPNS